jgi:predicted aspartyl protease
VSDVGILRVTIGVESHVRRGAVHELPDTMVDTGSEYTWVPRAILQSLGIDVERVERFVTADGRVIAREMGYAIVHAAGARTSDEVVFAEPGDMVLLGAHTIEGMNLRGDLKQKRLVPAWPVPAATGACQSIRRLGHPDFSRARDVLSMDGVGPALDYVQYSLVMNGRRELTIVAAHNVVRRL